MTKNRIEVPAQTMDGGPAAMGWFAALTERRRGNVSFRRANAVALMSAALGFALIFSSGCQSPITGAGAEDEGDVAQAESQSPDSSADQTSGGDPAAPSTYESQMPPEPGAPTAASSASAPAPSSTQSFPGSSSSSAPTADLSAQFRELEANEKIADSERVTVVEALIDQARADMANGELQTALTRLDEAVALLPGHREASQMRNDVLRAMGTAGGDLSLHDMLSKEAKVQRDQLRMEAIAHYRAGSEHYEQAEYEDASHELQRFLDAVKWSAYDLELDDLLQPAQQLKNLADKRAAEAKLSEDASRRREQRDKVLAQEKREARNKVRRIQELYENGIREFEQQNYDASESISREILKLNPGDRHAQRLKDESVMLRHRDADRDVLAEKAKQWRNFLRDMQEARIPFHEILTFPDTDWWGEMSEERLASTQFDSGATDDSPAVAAIKSRLENQRISLEFEDTPLPDVLAFIQDIAGINIVLDQEVRDEFESNGTLISLPVRDLKLSSALDILFNMHGLKGTYNNDVLFVTTAAKVVGDTVLRLHDIKDLIVTLTDFPGASIQLVEAGDEAGGAVFGGDEPTPTFDPDSIVELITTSISPETWDEDPARFSITASGGNLIVRHTPQVHSEIHKFLSDLRAFSGILVTVETRFLQVSDYFLESVGVDIRGLGDSFQAGQGVTNNQTSFANMPNLPVGDGQIGSSSPQAPGGRFDNLAAGTLSSGFFFKDENQDVRGRSEPIFDRPLGRNQRDTGGLALQWALIDDAEYNFIIQAVSKSTQATELIAPSLTAFNTQRSNITIANQVSYISDFDVEVAQTSQIADPIVSVIQDGLVLDVRPTVSYDLKYVTLEIKPTVALLRRPISVLQTSLGAGGQVRIQLPELEVQSAATTVRVPDGGSLLLGGLKTAFSQDRNSSVPIVDNIPVLSFFFRKKGRADEFDNLLILVRSHITDMAEAERQAMRGF